jgi:hypothetical protein
MSIGIDLEMVGSTGRHKRRHNPASGRRARGELVRDALKKGNGPRLLRFSRAELV